MRVCKVLYLGSVQILSRIHSVNIGKSRVVKGPERVVEGSRACNDCPSSCPGFSGRGPLVYVICFYMVTLVRDTEPDLSRAPIGSSGIGNGFDGSWRSHRLLRLRRSLRSYSDNPVFAGLANAMWTMRISRLSQDKPHR